MATASKLNFPPILYVTVPPAQDVPNAVYNQEIVFESMSQQYTICFATNPLWPSISGKSFSNQTRTSITTPGLRHSRRANTNGNEANVKPSGLDW